MILQRILDIINFINPVSLSLLLGDLGNVFLAIKVSRGSFFGSHFNTVYMLSFISHLVN